MFSKTSLVTSFVMGVKHNLRSGNGLTPLCILYFALSFLLTTFLALASAWWQVTSMHLDKQGVNRLTLEATTNMNGLDMRDLALISEKFTGHAGFRIVPQYTSILYLMAADGTYKPFIASSMVEDDPTLLDAPELAPTREPVSDGNSGLPAQYDGSKKYTGLVLSLDIIRRLGFASVAELPNEINIRVQRAGRPVPPWHFSLPVSGIAGDLGKLGVRVPLDKMLQIRSFQYSRSDNKTKGVAINDRGTDFEHADDLEINAIHIQIPADISMEEVIGKVNSVDISFQLSSPYLNGVNNVVCYRQHYDWRLR